MFFIPLSIHNNPLGKNGYEYFHAVFRQSSQITGLASAVNRFCIKLSVNSRLTCVTDGRTDRRKSDLNSEAYDITLAENERAVDTLTLQRL